MDLKNRHDIQLGAISEPFDHVCTYVAASKEIIQNIHREKTCAAMYIVARVKPAGGSYSFLLHRFRSLLTLPVSGSRGGLFSGYPSLLQQRLLVTDFR